MKFPIMQWRDSEIVGVVNPNFGDIADFLALPEVKATEVVNHLKATPVYETEEQVDGDAIRTIRRPTVPSKVTGHRHLVKGSVQIVVEGKEHVVLYDTITTYYHVEFETVGELAEWAFGLGQMCPTLIPYFPSFEDPTFRVVLGLD